MIQSFVGPFGRILDARRLEITFVDIGARNGVLQLADLAPWVKAYGFEPNPEEYGKLLNNTTDAFRIAGIESPKYKSLEYSPFAISDQNGRSTFYITPGPGACGLLEPDVERLREIKWKGRTFKKSFGDDIFADYRTTDVDTRTIESWASGKGVSHIDFLKIDVEGSEYEVLSGASGLLARTGVIEVETCFIPFRKRQKLFSDVDQLLRPFGFDLLRFEIEQSQVGYKRREKPIQELPRGYYDAYGQPLSCDAIYVNRSISNSDRALAAAAVLLDKNYVDEALFILDTKAAVRDRDFLEMLRTYDRGVTKGLWLRGRLYTMLDRILARAGRLTGLGTS